MPRRQLPHHKIFHGGWPGVPALHAGAGFCPFDINAFASIEKHGDTNVLTLDKGTAKLTQGCGAPISITLAEMALFKDEWLRVTAFDPPVFFL